MPEHSKYVHDHLGWQADYISSSDTFRISSGSSHLGNLHPHAIRTMPDWKPVKSVLFVSEEGKDVFDGDEYFIVGTGYDITRTIATLDNVYAKGILRFRYEESAKGYIILHKTVFSLKDIIEFSTSEGVEIAEQIAKSRLFPESVVEEPKEKEALYESQKEVTEKPTVSISETVQQNHNEGFENLFMAGKPTIHQKLEEIKSKETNTSSPETINQKVMSVLGTEGLSMDSIKRAIASKYPKEKISDGKIYKALDELEVSFIVTKTTRQKDGRFVYSL